MVVVGTKKLKISVTKLRRTTSTSTTNAHFFVWMHFYSSPIGVPSNVGLMSYACFVPCVVSTITCLLSRCHPHAKSAPRNENGWLSTHIFVKNDKISVYFVYSKKQRKLKSDAAAYKESQSYNGGTNYLNSRRRISMPHQWQPCSTTSEVEPTRRTYLCLLWWRRSAFSRLHRFSSTTHVRAKHSVCAARVVFP